MTELLDKTSKTSCVNSHFIWDFLTNSYYFNVWHGLTPDLQPDHFFELNKEYNLTLGKNLGGFSQKIKVLQLTKPSIFEFSLYSPMFFISDLDENRTIVSIQINTYKNYTEINLKGKTNHTPSKMYEDFISKMLSDDLKSIIKNLDEGYLEKQAINSKQN